MKKVYLCGHTGSINRGCEAIVRSTVDILKMCGVDDVNLFTFNKSDDIRFGLDEKINLISYPQKSFYAKAMTYAKRKFLKDSLWGSKYLYKKLLKNAGDDAILFNIGGDIYCYKTPVISYALNDVAKQKGLPNVFWGCSINNSTLKNDDMIRDLNKYSCVVVREKLSEQIFEQCLTDKTKLYKTCDPAFHLETKVVPLPDNFKEGNTLGLNVSPLVFKNVNDDNDMMYQNVYTLIDYVISDTDMNICLIPHVYDYKTNLEDSKVLTKIFDRYKGSARVSIVDKDYSCTELKHIISKCRFFIGARTHSTIAAYSSAVPCIALSYSIKSRGIATDLFGTDKGYSMPYKAIKDKNELKNNFVEVLVNNEEKIRKIYDEVLPSYKQSIIDSTKEILEKL